MDLLARLACHSFNMYVSCVMLPVLLQMDLLIKLVVQILVPLFVGKTARELIPPVRRFCHTYKACGS